MSLLLFNVLIIFIISLYFLQIKMIDVKNSLLAITILGITVWVMPVMSATKSEMQTLCIEILNNHTSYENNINDINYVNGVSIADQIENKESLQVSVDKIKSKLGIVDKCTTELHFLCGIMMDLKKYVKKIKDTDAELEEDLFTSFCKFHIQEDDSTYLNDLMNR